MIPKIDVPKYGFTEIDELIRCPHCHKENIYHVKFHYEKREKRLGGKVVIPLELIEFKVYDMSPPPLCERCEKIAKCEDCGIILCGRKKHTHSWSATQDPKLCQGCYDWKNKSYPQ